MSTGLNTNNSTIVSAFYNELLRQGLVVALTVLLVGAAWSISRSAQLRRAVIEHQQRGPAGAVFAAPEARARRLLRVSFGILWIFDGILQGQASIPLGMAPQVIQPAAASSPGWVQRRRLLLAGAVAGTVLCLADWVLVQDPGFMGGVGTGPNSMVPTVVLIWAGYLAFTRVPAAALAAAPTGAADGEVAVAGLPWRERLAANPRYISTDYLAAFDRQEGLKATPNWLFLTGTRPQPQHAWRFLGALVQYTPGGAMIDHSEFAYVIDPSGRVRYDLDTDPGPATGATASCSAVTLAGTLNKVLKEK